MAAKKEKKSKETKASLKNEVRTKILGYVTAGFGLVASLAWNEAIKEAITLVFPQDQNSLIAKFLYATIVTVVVVVVGYYASTLFVKDE